MGTKRSTEGETRGKVKSRGQKRTKGNLGSINFTNKVIVLRALKCNHPVLFFLLDQS